MQLKADTGLSRGGATPDDWPDLCAAAAEAEAGGEVEVTGLWSHFAFADGGPDHPVNGRQRQVFAEALEIADRAGLRPEVRHLANSAATLTAPATHYDLVRPGVSVYGLCPVPQLGAPRDFGLRPAMTLASTVALTKRVPAGSGVSYLHRHVTERESTLALVPLGYADGVPRSATSTGQVQLRGVRRTIAGTVCMDQFVLDVGDDEVAAGDEVLLFGPGDDGEPTAQDWADAARHDRLRDRHPGRRAGAAGVRAAERVRGQDAPVRSPSAGLVGAALGVVATGVAVGLAAERYAVGRLRAAPRPGGRRAVLRTARRPHPHGADRGRRPAARRGGRPAPTPA